MAPELSNYFWRDGFLVRRPRPVLVATFHDDAGKELFEARSANATALEAFGLHAVETLPNACLNEMRWQT